MHPGLPLLIIGAVLAVVGMVLMAIGGSQWGGKTTSVVPAGATLSASELKAEAIQTSQELITFVDQRQNNEPVQSDYYSRGNITDENWDAWTQALLAYHHETKNLYASKFGGQVKYLQDQLQRWGLTNQALDWLCEDATNYIIIRDGAIALHSLAQSLTPD